MNSTNIESIKAWRVRCGDHLKGGLYLANGNEIRFGYALGGIPQVYVISRGNAAILACEETVISVVNIRRIGDLHSIMDAASKKYFSATLTRPDVSGSFSASKNLASHWELFCLSEFECDLDWAIKYLDILDYISVPLTLEMIRDGACESDWSVIEFGLAVSPPDVLKHNVAKMLNDIEFLKGLKFATARSRMLNILIENISDRGNGGRPRFIGQDRDYLGHYINPRDPWIKLITAIRNNIAVSAKSCVVATARNEGVYLLEWIAHTLEIGFDKIFIYTNDNQDGSLELLEALHKEGVIELIISEVGDGGNAQVKAYNHALLFNDNVMRYEWCAFIDVDEFISIDTSRFSGINEFLDWQNSTGANAIALSWMLVANKVDGGDWIDLPLTQRLTKLSDLQSHLIKCISKPREMHLSGPHYPIANGGLPALVVDSEGKRYQSKALANPDDITQPLNPTTQNAFLYHYETKSFPELLWKYSRNRGNYSAVRSDIYINDSFLGRIRHFEKCLERPDAKSFRLSVPLDNLVEKISELKKLDGVGEAYSGVASKTRARYEKLEIFLKEYLDKNIKQGEEYGRDWIVNNVL